jgi:hypothetical protein
VRPTALGADQARSLEGKLRLYRVTLDSTGTEHAGRVGYDALHDDDVPTTPRRRAGVLKVIKHPKRGSRGQFGGFTEYRLVGSVERE